MEKRTVKRAAKSIIKADSRVAKAAARHRDSPAIEIISKLSEVGDQPQLRTLCCAVIAGGVLSKRPRLARSGVRMLLAHELATAMKTFIKDRVDRTRPRSAKTVRQSKVRAGDSGAKEETSFPSGHTAGAVAVAQAFAHEFPQYGRTAQVAAAAVGLAQIPRCAHYPTDVGVGAVIGVSAEAVIGALSKAISQDASDAPTPAAPPRLPRRAAYSSRVGRGR